MLDLPPLKVWTQRMRHIADSAGVTDHRFLQELTTKPSADVREDLIRWAKQDYFVSRKFPCLLGAIIGKIEDPEPRHVLVRNLWEEHGEGSRRQTHHALFCKLLVTMGLEGDIPNLAITPATRNFIEIQESLASEHVLLGLGAFCYANEYITVDEFAPLEKSVEYEFPEADLSFFAANRQVDARHAAESEHVISMLMSTAEDRSLVERGAVEALRARVSFYDSLLGDE